MKMKVEDPPMSDMDPHMQAAVYGTPQINPDERNHYLGTFRERVYAAQTRDTFGQAAYMPTWEAQFRAHPDGTLFLNGHLELDDLSPYMQLASKYSIGFTLKSDDVFDRSDIVAVFAAKEAVNIDQIDIVKLTKAPTVEGESQPAAKKPWYKRLFG
ncbi:YueI family protein [Weissella cibaria]|nr:YueI family protein [Weissella cibaria]